MELLLYYGIVDAGTVSVLGTWCEVGGEESIRNF